MAGALPAPGRTAPLALATAARWGWPSKGLEIEKQPEAADLWTFFSAP